MLSVALRTLRSRWKAFAGTFVALALGVAMSAAMGLVLAATFGTAPEHGPQRYVRAPVVVRAGQTLTVSTGKGKADSRPLADPKGVSPELITKVSAVGAAVPDRSFYAYLAGGGPSRVGHPWSAAGFGPYRLTAGHAPRDAGQIVVGGGGVRPGDRVTVLTADRQKSYLVTGVTAPVGFEHAIFFTDAEAAALSPRVDALVVDASPAAVREAVGDRAEVLTGAGRRKADPDPNKDRATLDNTNVLLGIAAGVAGFVAVFVVASTFAFAVAQRRRELALLRTIGATPRQVRRMLLGEALLVGVIASAFGCALAPPGAILLGHWLADRGLAPSWFGVTLSWWPLIIAFTTGVCVALLGVQAASRRAGRVRAVEALRDAAVDRSVMTIGRWLFGLAFLGGGLATLVTQVASDPGAAGNRKGYTPTIMMLIAGLALLAPLVVPPLARLLTWPLGRTSGAGGMVVRENALTAVRRTAAAAAPVMITVGLAASLLGAGSTVDATRAADLRHETNADYMVMPTDGARLSSIVVDRVRSIGGVDVAVSVPTTVYMLQDGVSLQRVATQATDPAELTRMTRYPVLSGSPAELRDDSIVVDQDSNVRAGDHVAIWLGDGTRTELRVAAVLKSGIDGTGAFLTPKYGGAAGPQRIDVKLRPGADVAAVTTALRAATQGLGAKVVPVRAWLTDTNGMHGRSSRLGMLVVLGIALAYCGISIANTLAMATTDRVRDQAILRLSGATPRQVLRVVAGESLLVVVVGAVLALGVSVLSLVGQWAALRQLSSEASIVIPWGPVIGITAACGLIALVSSLLPARAAMRIGPVEAAGVRES